MVDQVHIKKKDHEYLKKIFCMFDKDSDGYITETELETVLKSFKLHLSDKEIKQQVRKVMADGDKDKNGTLDFEEFLVFMEGKIEHHDSALKEMRDAFRMFDCDGNGFIEANELKSVMEKLGHNLNDKEVDAMIKDADLDGNGKIDFDEYVKYMMEKE